MMRRHLYARLKALEDRAPEAAKPPKAVLPGWLVEDLGKHGVCFDGSGRPDMTSVSGGGDRAIHD